MFYTNRVLLPVAFLVFATPAFAREWSDLTGNFKIEGSLISFDKDQVVIKVDDKDKINGHELLAIKRKDLSKSDLEYLSTKEAIDFVRSLDKSQTWTMKDGTKVIGKAVDFTRKDVTVQSRRSKIYVNDKLFDNLPEIYQKMLPRIVEKFEGIKLSTSKDFERWIMTLDGKPKTYTCEGVILELESGDEYGFPFFLFNDRDLQVLRPGWEQWDAAEKDAEQKRQSALYMQSQATNYQQNIANQLAIQNQIGIAQLQMMAVASGVVDLWQVYLEPGQGVMGYPITVVVPARNSQAAAIEAANANPGYVPGPVRKLYRK